MKQTTTERNNLIYQKYLDEIRDGLSPADAVIKISGDVKLRPAYVSIILKGFGVEADSLKPSKHEERDEEIVKMFINGIDHAEIASKFDITSTRVGQIVRDALGKFSKLSAMEKMLDQIKTDIEDGLDHKQIVEKYGEPQLQKIRRNLGFNAFEAFTTKRNTDILDKYKSGKSAQDIADLYEMTRDHVYGILRTFGIKKRPTKKEYSSRNKNIVTDFKRGMNSNQLADKYDMTVTNINIILKNNEARSEKTKAVEEKVLAEFKSGKINVNNISKIAKKYKIKVIDVKKILKEKKLI